MELTPQSISIATVTMINSYMTQYLVHVNHNRWCYSAAIYVFVAMGLKTNWQVYYALCHAPSISEPSKEKATSLCTYVLLCWLCFLWAMRLRLLYVYNNKWQIHVQICMSYGMNYRTVKKLPSPVYCYYYYPLWIATVTLYLEIRDLFSFY